MKPILIIKLLRWAATLLFIFLGLLAVIFLLTAITQGVFAFNGKHEAVADPIKFRVLDLAGSATQTKAVADSAYFIQPVPNEYLLTLKPGSGADFYTLIIREIHILLGMAILFLFIKIFRGLQSPNPFQSGTIRLLKRMALIFFIADAIDIINYFVFNKLISLYEPSARLELITDIGDNILTGLIILVIAFVFERGVELQSENELTV